MHRTAPFVWSRWLAGSSILAAFFACPSAGSAYPISPRPLWQQVEESTWIVLADVAAVKDVERPAHADAGTIFFGDQVATLDVREVWKGKLGDQVLVRYPANLICPAPPRYVPGKRVLAFLVRGKDGEPATLGLSYGTLYPAAGYVADFRAMVAAALRLQAKGKVSTADRLAWAVEAAARPGTRWHGLFDLFPAGDEIHSFYDREGRPLAGSRLSRQQLDLLARSFITAPTTDQTAVMMLGLLGGWRSPELDRTAAGIVEALVAEKEPAWWLRDLFTVVLARFGEQHPEKRLATLGKEFDRFTAAQARALWQRARKELAIPEADPVRILEPEARGVGGRTPS